MISVRELCFAYRRGVPILRGLSFELGSGLVAVLGANGSGKSTLLRILAGVQPPDRGSVHIDGHDLDRDEVAARRALVYVPEQPQLHPFATVWETACFAGRLHGLDDTRLEASLERFGVLAVAHRLPSELSQGQQRRAHLAIAAATSASHLLLDEPFDALDQGAIELLLEWIDQSLARGATVVAVSHMLQPLIPRAEVVLALDGQGAARLETPRGWSEETWRRVAGGRA